MVKYRLDPWIVRASLRTFAVEAVRRGRRAAVVAIALSLAMRVGAAAAEPVPIGPYTVERSGDAIAVRAGDGDRIALALVAAGLVIAAVGALRKRQRAPWLLLGAGLAIVGGVARIEGGAAWTVTREGVAEARRFRPVHTVSRAGIEAIEIAARRPTGADAKAATPPRLVEVRVRERDGASPLRFAFEREDDAQRFAALLAETLGVAKR